MDYNKIDWCKGTLELAQDVSTPKKTLDYLAKDEYWIIREAVAGNENTSCATLDILANDKDENVKLATAGNINTSKETLDGLAATGACNIRLRSEEHTSELQSH